MSEQIHMVTSSYNYKDLFFSYLSLSLSLSDLPVSWDHFGVLVIGLIAILIISILNEDKGGK